MSQKKVDKYKEEKANRSQIIKKQKRVVRIEIIAMAVVVVGLLGWFAWSYHERDEKIKPPTEYPIESGAIDDYLNGLDTADTEAEDAGADDTEAEDTEADDAETEE